MKTDPPIPRQRNHYLPRTRNGRISVGIFLILFFFCQPPLLFLLANRIEPSLLGMPFLYAYLLVDYLALIAVLIWARLKGV